MPPTIIRVDLKKSVEEQPIPLHNRWHPDIPPIARVRLGEPFRLLDCWMWMWTTGQVKDNDNADHIHNVDLRRVHILSGPISVEGAEPNDFLVVDILDIGTLPDSEWGFTGIFSKTNCGGFLTNHYPNAAKAIWKYENLSVGDLHFCQGDGEISFCGGIEMAGYIDLKVSLIKNGVNKYKQKNAMFAPSSSRLTYGPQLVFEGISVDEAGRQHYLDANVAYRQACLNAIEYLKTQGFTGEQAYMLLSSAPIEGHLSGVVYVPNSCCTLALPLEIFDRDIRPQVDVEKSSESAE